MCVGASCAVCVCVYVSLHMRLSALRHPPPRPCPVAGQTVSRLYPSSERLVVRARVHRVGRVGEHRGPEDGLAPGGHEGDRLGLEVGEAGPAAAALGHVVQVHEEREDSHALDAVAVSVDVVRVALVEGARLVALCGARVVVHELRKLAVCDRRARDIAHSLLHRLDERVGEAVPLLAPGVPRGADLRLDVGHLAVLVEADAARLGVLPAPVRDEGVRLGVGEEGVEEQHRRVGRQELGLQVAEVRQDPLEGLVHSAGRQRWLCPGWPWAPRPILRPRRLEPLLRRRPLLGRARGRAVRQHERLVVLALARGCPREAVGRRLPGVHLSRRETSRSLARLQCGGGVGAGGLALLLHEGGVGGAFARRRPVAAVLVHVLALLPQLLLLLLGRCNDRLVVAWLGRPLPRRLARRELVVVRLAARRVHRRSPPARQLRRRCRCSRRCSRLNCRGDILLMQGRVRRRPLRPTDVRDTGSEKRNHRRRDQPDRRLGTATAA
mmetsp:Transcript_7218/g.21250  ORF Transcript_7218/g.21250 Transcript_7218/m.21250 type:complete len:495 (-) Transcript_7218:205-1689(-)